MRYLDTKDANKKANIIALVANDKFCASIVEDGEIKVIKKLSGGIDLSFQEYLNLENSMFEKENKVNNLEHEILKSKKNVGLSVTQGSLATILFLLSQFILPSASTGLILLGKVLFGGIGLFSIGMIVNNISKILKMERAIKCLDKQINQIVNRIYYFAVGPENVFTPSKTTTRTKDDCINNIKDSASFVYCLLQNYVKQRTGEDIYKTKVIYVENDFMHDEPIFIRLPIDRKEIDVGNDVIDSMAKKTTYHTMMDTRFSLISDEEEKGLNKTLVRKFPV